VDQTKKQNQNKTKQKIPSSNAIQFQLVLQHPVLVLSLCYQRKRKKKKKNLVTAFYKCLSEAVAHLLPTFSQMLLQVLSVAALRNELYTHLATHALFI
jgi:hypothetical protein